MRRFSLLWAAAALVLLFPGCENDKETIPFRVYTPEGQDTFAGVSQLRLVFGGNETTSSLAGPDAAFELTLDLSVGETSRVLLEGLDSSGDVVCRGRSPKVLSVGSDEQLVLYVARLGSFGRSPAVLATPATGAVAVPYRVEDWNGVFEDDISATLFFGGVTSEGTVLPEPFYYDAYVHETSQLTSMPAPRTGVAAFNIDGAYFLIFGGRDAGGEISGQVDLMKPGAASFEYEADLDYGVEGAARAGAAQLTLGPYATLVEGSENRLLNSFLVVGGQGPEGPACDALHLVAKLSLSLGTWVVEGELRDLVACRVGHTATLTERAVGSESQRVVLIYGGADTADASAPVAEVLRLQPTQVDVDTVDWRWSGEALPDPGAGHGPGLTGHTATRLPDGRILVLGGETADGTLLADGVIYDPADDSFEVIEDLLETARAAHTAVRMGDELVVAGGTGPDGQPLGDAEILDVSGLLPVAVDIRSLSAARTGHAAFVMSTGTMGLSGGTGPDGDPLGTIDIYTPGLLE